MSQRSSTGDSSPPFSIWSGRRIARGAMIAVLGLSLIGGPLSVDASRPVAVSLSGMSAVITGSGDGVNVRAKPSFDAEILTEIAEGTQVTLRIDQVDTVLDADGTTRWWPIAVYGTDGWVTGSYLSDGSATAGAGLGVEPTEPAETAAATSTTATLATTVAADPASMTASADATAATARVADPDGVNVRTEPDASSDVITLATAGSVVVLRTDTINIVTDADDVAWWPVDVNGQLGWVVGAYLSSGADETAPTDTTAAGNVLAGGFTAGDRVSSSTGTADGLNIRAEPAPGTDVIGYVRPGDIVQVLAGPDGYESSTAGWYRITNGDVTGYVDGDLLVAASQLAGDEPVASASGSSSPTDADTAATTEPTGSSPLVGTSVAIGAGDGDDVNIRATVGTSGDIVVTVPDGTSTDVLDGPFYDTDGTAWLYVSSGSGEGFVIASLVGVTAAAPATTEPEASATQPAASTAPSAAAAATETPAAPSPTATVEATEPAAPVAPVAGTATGTFLFPAAGRVSQEYGCTSVSFEPVDANLGCPFHNALDIAAPMNTPIIASDGGTVTFAGWCDCGLGFYVEIDHGNGYSTVYGHMAAEPFVATGQKVSQGETIGPMGSTGFSTGPHTHFEVLLNGSTIDPRTVLSSVPA